MDKRSLPSGQDGPTARPVLTGLPMLVVLLQAQGDNLNVR